MTQLNEIERQVILDRMKARGDRGGYSVQSFNRKMELYYVEDGQCNTCPFGALGPMAFPKDIAESIAEFMNATRV